MNNQQQRPQGSLGINTQQQQQQQQDENNKITPELLVDALSGHEDGLLSIAERLMTHYDAGYDAMGEAIIDAFADVQKLFQHVVEAAHMEGAALERERGEGEWKKRMESLGIDQQDVEGVLYGQVNEDSILNGTAGLNISPSKNSASLGDDDPNSPQNNTHGNLSSTKSEEPRHEELIDQDVRDVLIDAIKRGQTLRDTNKFNECRTLYEGACGNASSLLPVDSDHRGRLQLAVARAESMSADRACAILKYAMDDVLRSGLTLRRGKHPLTDMNERSDCVLARPNPLRTTPSRGYDVNGNSTWDLSNITRGSASGILGGGGGGIEGEVSTSMVEQSAEEALNSLVEEMKEMLDAPVYNLTPLQNVSEKFWLALSEAKKSSKKKEERLEQALAEIKGEFLMAREEYEEKLVAERERQALMKRQFKLEISNNSTREYASNQQQREDGTSGDNEFHMAPQSVSEGGSGGGNVQYLFAGMDDATNTSSYRHGHRSKGNSSSGQSVVSIGSEFAQKARSLVHLMNCREGRDYIPNDATTSSSTRKSRNSLDRERGG